MAQGIILRPRMSEKAYGLSQTKNVYVFEVPMEANKQVVVEAVAKQFDVTVENVRMLIAKGKPKRSMKGRGRIATSHRADVKKAYVTLKEGDSIPIFAALEEEADDKKESK